MNSPAEGSNSIPLGFNKITETEREVPQWTDSEIREAIVAIYQNLQKLDSYVSDIVRLHLIYKEFLFYFITYSCYFKPFHLQLFCYMLLF